MSASILKTILNKQQTTTIYHYLESLHPPFQYVIQVKICVVPHAVDDRNPTVASNRTAQEQCDQIQQNSLWQFLKLYLVYCKILKHKDMKEFSKSDNVIEFLDVNNFYLIY